MRHVRRRATRVAKQRLRRAARRVRDAKVRHGAIVALEHNGDRHVRQRVGQTRSNRRHEAQAELEHRRRGGEALHVGRRAKVARQRGLERQHARRQRRRRVVEARRREQTDNAVAHAERAIVQLDGAGAAQHELKCDSVDSAVSPTYTATAGRRTRQLTTRAAPFSIVATCKRDCQQTASGATMFGLTSI
jgi:hypothetical protein